MIYTGQSNLHFSEIHCVHEKTAPLSMF